ALAASDPMTMLPSNVMNSRRLIVLPNPTTVPRIAGRRPNSAAKAGRSMSATGQKRTTDLMSQSRGRPLYLRAGRKSAGPWWPRGDPLPALQHAGDRRHPRPTIARSGHDSHRRSRAGAQLDGVWNFFEAHNYRYALRESDPLEGRANGGQ